MLRWYLIHTKPSAERIAQLHLQRQDFETYLPELVQSVRRHAERCEQIVPLFPRYLFLRLDEGRQTLSPVRATIGVSNVVRFGSRFAIVPDGVVRDLRARADCRSGLHKLHCQPKLSAGDAVSLMGGTFDGLQGIFEREAGVERVVVLLDVLGQYTRVSVTLKSIVPVVPVMAHLGSST